MTAPLDQASMDMAAEQLIEAAPMPTSATLSHRRNFFYQLVRFVAINLRMIRVIRSSH